MSDAPVPKLILPVDDERIVSISPHRFRQTPSILIIIEDEHMRIDLHLNDTQLRLLYQQISAGFPEHAAVSMTAPVHPPTSQCPDMECTECAARDCPYQDGLHYHHDGCPSCSVGLRAKHIKPIPYPIDLRRVQHSAWDMNLLDFCAALGWSVDDYTKQKFRDFQEVGRYLAGFDDGVLRILADASKR